jgi:cytochrome c biogenesis protein CcdA
VLRLLGLVVSIALADSLNPSTIGPGLLLASGESPRRSVLEFAASTFVVFLFGGLVLVLGPGRLILSLVPHPVPTVRYSFEIFAGAVMLVIAGILWRRRERLTHRKGSSGGSRPTGHRHSPARMGATIAIIELPTAFPYFAAILAIVGSGTGVVRGVVLLAIYNVCFVLPLLGIAAALSLAGERALEILARARKYGRDHWPVLVAVALLSAGLIVTALGVTGLTSSLGGTVGHVSRRLRHLIPH